MSSSDDDIICYDDSESDLDNDSGCIEDVEPEVDCGRDYDILSLDDVTLEMRAISVDVSQVIGMPPAACRLLLKYYKWDKAKLLDEFTDCPEPTVFLSDRVHMDYDDARSFNTFEGECDICCCDGELSAFKCGHTACKDCWNSYVTIQVKDENMLDIKCIDGTCGIVLHDEQVLSFLQDSEVKMLFCRSLSNGFVDANRLLKWCPGNDCGRIVKLYHPMPQSVYCKCSYSFCSSCGLVAHAPVTCEQLKIWMQKQKDEGESLAWIAENTKPCPVCRVPIQKISGCNYMQCRNNTCNSFFCWVCLQRLAQNHQPHDCHRYNAQPNGGNLPEDWERYKHYHNRFQTHAESLKLEQKLHSKVAVVTRRMTRLCQQTTLKLAKLPDSVLTLLKCRQVLVYTYPFTYFVANDMNKAILEDNLKDLEAATEQLSAIIDHDVVAVTEENFNNVLIKLCEKTKYVDSRRQVLLKHCSEIVEG